jgi:hypothetical protein
MILLTISMDWQRFNHSRPMQLGELDAPLTTCWSKHPRKVYDIGLDGAKPRHLQLQSACDPYGLSVTRDGQHAVCSARGPSGDGILLFSPVAQHDGGRLLTLQASSQAAPPVNRIYPTLAPDGVHLAMIEASATVCSIAIVTVDAASATFQPSAYLTFSEDGQGRCCSMIWHGLLMVAGSS